MILTKQILWSGEGKILIGIDLREMGGKAGENIDNCFEKFPANEQKNGAITARRN